jgi:iron(III) transport system ATP-binding protein
MQTLEMVQLADYAQRPSPHLSGGQQQRVALARALVHQPALLLLDEPLSNLDAKLRDAMRVELRLLVKSLGITTVFVTHDQLEAMSMSDQVALMRAGSIAQLGPPREVYLRPNKRLSSPTSWAQQHDRRCGQCRVVRNDGVREDELRRPALRAFEGTRAGSAVLVVIRPQAITASLTRGEAVRENTFEARIERLHSSR